MQAFKKVDMESWPRREHYRYYTEALKVEFNMTAPVDVQNLLRFCHAHGYKFYAAAIYCVTKAAQPHRELPHVQKRGRRTLCLG